MVNTFNLRNIYAKIQKQLFYIIPEKWDRLYLYASVIEKVNNIETGEMFFYYYPKGLLKKNPINVYEIPSKFNIEENAYINLVDKLYDTIKLLRKEYEKAKEKLWSNLTISIENFKFNVEYNYEDLFTSTYSNYDRHIIWKYKYLNFPIERLAKRDREMLKRFLIEEDKENKEIKQYTEMMYKSKVHNIIDYNREETIKENKEYNIKPSIPKIKEKKLDKYELYKINKEKQKEISDIVQEQGVRKVNQILNF